MAASQPVWRRLIQARHIAVVVCWVAIGGQVALANNDPAQFWISTSQKSNAPEAPTIDLPAGRTERIYIWARPETDTNGNFKQLEDFSLDVVSLVDNVSQLPVFDIMDNFRVYNPSNSRYDPGFVHDSALPDSVNDIFSTQTLNNVISGQPDSIRLVQDQNGIITPHTGSLSGGFIQLSTNYTGIGAQVPGDNLLTGNLAAWEIAYLDLTGVAASGASQVHLQIGSLGMYHATDIGTGDTNVRFGNSSDPIYNAGGSIQNGGQREMTLPGDTADLIVNGAPFMGLGDFNRDGHVNTADISAMEIALTNLPRYESMYPVKDDELSFIDDVNGDGIFNNADLQYLLTTLKTGGGSADSVPEPASNVLLGLGALAIAFCRRSR